MTGAARTFAFIAAVNGFLAVAFGAFGAHALKERLTAASLATFETGVRYEMYHALALLAVGILIGQLGESKLLKSAGWLFTIGIILFSGSLFALATTGVKVLGAVTPFGGLCFLAGWTCLAVGTLKSPSK